MVRHSVADWPFFADLQHHRIRPATLWHLTCNTTWIHRRQRHHTIFIFLSSCIPVLLSLTLSVGAVAVAVTGRLPCRRRSVAVPSQVCVFRPTCDGNRPMVSYNVANQPYFADLRSYTDSSATKASIFRPLTGTRPATTSRGILRHRASCGTVVR